MKKLVLATAVAVLVMGLSSQAPADNLTVTLNGGPACLDNTACDGNSTLGVVVVTTSTGTVTVTGVGTGAPANAPLGLDVGYVVSTSSLFSLGGTATIEVSENNLSTGGSPVSWNGINAGTNINTSVTGQAWADAGNSLFAHTTSICGPLSSSAPGFSLTCTSGLFNDTSFSLTELITVGLPIHGQSIASGDFGISTVPEPGALLLVGSALLGIGLAARAGILRRRFFGRTAA